MINRNSQGLFRGYGVLLGLLLIFLRTISIACTDTSASAAQAYIRLDSVEVGESPSLTDSVLSTNAVYDKKLDVELYRERIESLAQSIRSKASKQEGTVSVASLLAGLKFSGEYQYELYQASVIDLIDRKVGNCVGTAMLALCVAESLGIDMYVMEVPNHVYAQVPTSEGIFDLELTSGVTFPSTLRPPDFYFPSDPRKGKAGKRLSPREVLGVYRASLAQVLLGELRYDNAYVLSQQALLDYPNAAHVQATWGAVNSVYGQDEIVREAYSKAIELEPFNPRHYAGQSRFESSKGESEIATQLIRKAIEIEPQFPAYYIWESDALSSDGRTLAALESLNKALEVEWEDLAPLLRMDHERYFSNQSALQTEVIIRRGRLYSRLLGPIPSDPAEVRKRDRLKLLAELSACLAHARNEKFELARGIARQGKQDAAAQSIADDSEVVSILALIDETIAADAFSRAAKRHLELISADDDEWDLLKTDNPVLWRTDESYLFQASMGLDRAVLNNGHDLVQLDADGKELARIRSPKNACFVNASSNGEGAFWVSSLDQMFQMSFDDEAELREFSKPRSRSAPVILGSKHEEKFIFGFRGLSMMDANGVQLWHSDEVESIRSVTRIEIDDSPVLICSSGLGELHAFTESGEHLWKHEMDGFANRVVSLNQTPGQFAVVVVDEDQVGDGASPPVSKSQFTERGSQELLILDEELRVLVCIELPLWFEYVSQMALSPDDRFAALSVSGTNIAKDKLRNTVLLLDLMEERVVDEWASGAASTCLWLESDNSLRLLVASAGVLNCYEVER